MAKVFRGESLYELSAHAVIENFTVLRHGLEDVPETILFDVVHQMYQRKQMDKLTEELSNFTTFTKLLKVRDKRATLHKLLQATVERRARVPEILAQAYYQHIDKLMSKLSSPSHNSLKLSNTCKALELGFNLGGFLCESGWYPAASNVHRACINILRRLSPSEPGYMFVKLQCLAAALSSLSSYCQFSEAGNIYSELTSYIWDNKISTDSYPNLAHIYCELSNYFFMKSNYQEAYNFALDSVRHMTPVLPSKLKIDVLRQASKSCVVKREFSKAEILIKQAVSLAKSTYGDSHPKYADCLVDYGFYLLNVDCITASMQVYQNALQVREDSFGGDNVQVALAHEDLAYATYVNEYSSGKFSEARRHAELSLDILTKHLPNDHLFLASSKRVLALILEEIAIDSVGHQPNEFLLEKAEQLHCYALQLAKLSFGEGNVQTAKHYGNLGRLYQTMERYDEAEAMHLKAIKIKETILGPEDYEVALSVGHLASLYNYDMKEYRKAEQLYLRSIKIGKKLFGPTYSGLEYDYRGLIQVYEHTDEVSKYLEFRNILVSWKIAREEQNRDHSLEVAEENGNISLDDLIKTVTHIKSNSTVSAKK